MNVTMYGNSIDGSTLLPDLHFDFNHELARAIERYKSTHPEPCSSYVITVVIPATDPDDYRLRTK